MKLLSTIGWNSVVVEDVVRALHPEEVVIFYGYENEENKIQVEGALRKAMDACREEGIAVENVFVNPLDFRDCVKRMKGHLSEDAVVNFTGGTKVMALAASLVALSAGVPLVYCEKMGDDVHIVLLPLQGVSFEGKSLYTGHETQRAFVEMLKGRERMSRKEARKKLGIGDSTMTSLVRRFEKMNVVRAERGNREVVIRPLPGLDFLEVR